MIRTKVGRPAAHLWSVAVRHALRTCLELLRACIVRPDTGPNWTLSLSCSCMQLLCLYCIA